MFYIQCKGQTHSKTLWNVKHSITTAAVQSRLWMYQIFTYTVKVPLWIILCYLWLTGHSGTSEEEFIQRCGIVIDTCQGTVGSQEHWSACQISTLRDENEAHHKSNKSYSSWNVFIERLRLKNLDILSFAHMLENKWKQVICGSHRESTYPVFTVRKRSVTDFDKHLNWTYWNFSRLHLEVTDWWEGLGSCCQVIGCCSSHGPHAD